MVSLVVVIGAVVVGGCSVVVVDGNSGVVDPHCSLGGCRTQ